MFESLQVAAPSESLGSEKALAHIVYEMASFLRTNPEATNEELFLAVRWVLGLLGSEKDVLTLDLQLGLAGECRFLRELLDLAFEEGVGAATVLERWVDVKRDFAAHGISIEVKTTAQNTRVHRIESINQLEPAAVGETVYLYSVGIKPELLHDRKLTTYVDEVVRALVTPQGEADAQARARFFEKLETRGYHEAHRALYDVGPGLMINGALPARLYRASDLDYLRIGSFKNELLPSMVRNVYYDLELPDGLAHGVDERAVFHELISSHPV
ncbi:MAG TPA: PD-(D/E)XK motif protein [Candidatus Dormibacteraeota bacterium]|nr:PD-(D/E)XK motif protein [Candidatus Dormibacteraeota bacterium]